MPLRQNPAIQDSEIQDKIKFTINELLLPASEAKFSQHSYRRISKAVNPQKISHKVNSQYQAYFLIMPAMTGYHVSSFMAKVINTNHIKDILGNVPGAKMIRFTNFFKIIEQGHYYVVSNYRRDNLRPSNFSTANQLSIGPDSNILHSLNQQMYISELAGLAIRTINKALIKQTDNRTSSRILMVTDPVHVLYHYGSGAISEDMLNEMPLLIRDYHDKFLPDVEKSITDQLVWYDTPSIIVQLAVAMTLFDYEIIQSKADQP